MMCLRLRLLLLLLLLVIFVICFFLLFHLLLLLLLLLQKAACNSTFAHQIRRKGFVSISLQQQTCDV